MKNAFFFFLNRENQCIKGPREVQRHGTNLSSILVQAVLTRYHRLGGSNSKQFFLSHRFGGWEVGRSRPQQVQQIQNTPPGLQTNPFSRLLLSLQRHWSHRGGSTLMTSFKLPNPQTPSPLNTLPWGDRVSTCELGEGRHEHAAQNNEITREKWKEKKLGELITAGIREQARLGWLKIILGKMLKIFLPRLLEKKNESKTTF